MKLKVFFNLNLSLKVDKSIQPRTQTGTSIPGLINLLQSEWDSLMLEIHTLKQHLNTARQELSQALYQHEAACRVVARLIKERDQAREDLAKFKELAKMDIVEKLENKVQKGITEELAAKFSELSDTLSEARKTRKPPADLTEAEMSKFKENYSVILHDGVNGKSGIKCLELTHKDNGLVLTGGKNNVAVLHNFRQKTTRATFKHDSKITAVSFVPTDMLTPITCSADGIVKIWEVDMDDEYKTKMLYTAADHTKSVSGCTVHPYSDYCFTCSKDGSWAFHNIAEGKLLEKVLVPNNEPIYSGQLHPDGLMIATGLQSGKILIWDLRNQQVVQEIPAHKNPVKNICYSEKGYQMLSLAKNDPVPLFWDLRKIESQGPQKIEGERKSANNVMFDQYGTYFGIVGNVVEIYKTRGLSKIAEINLNSEAKLTGMKFGEKNRFLVCGTKDGSLKIFE